MTRLPEDPLFRLSVSSILPLPLGRDGFGEVGVASYFYLMVNLLPKSNYTSICDLFLLMLPPLRAMYTWSPDQKALGTTQ